MNPGKLGLTSSPTGSAVEASDSVGRPPSTTDLRHALGKLCVDAPDGLYASPKSPRELADVLAVLKSSGAVLGRDVKLSRAALDRLEAVEPKSCTVQVGAGIVLSDLERRLKPHGLTLGAMSPRALGLTLGEFLEGPYAGLRAIPVGRLEPLCVSLEAVLSDGRQLRTHFSPRSAAGPDLSALILGAHGRIGLVTSARVRCVPAPESHRQVRLSYPSIDAAIDALKDALADGCSLARVRAKAVQGRTVVEVDLQGSVDAVARDHSSLQHRAPLLGGRAAGEALAAIEQDAEHEATWPAIARALEGPGTLELYRLSLHGAVARGGAGGLKLDGPSRWAHGAALAAPVLGGSP
jgi:FAD/FMN-containing dehydrogenase